jgi:hypothetical protein
VSMMLMNIAATKTTETATFWLIRVPDSPKLNHLTVRFLTILDLGAPRHR